jgi:hypothetical protein
VTRRDYAISICSRGMLRYSQAVRYGDSIRIVADLTLRGIDQQVMTHHKRFTVWTLDDELIGSSDKWIDAIRYAQDRHARLGLVYYVHDSQAEFQSVRIPNA